MKKMLEEKIQKELLKDFKFTISDNINLRYIINEDLNMVTCYNQKVSYSVSIFDDEGYVIAFMSKVNNCKYIYDTINGKKVMVKRICKYPNIDTRVYEYIYDEKGNEIENLLNGKLKTKYEYNENGRLKCITDLIRNIKQEYKYEHGYTLVYYNGILSHKYDGMIKTYFEENGNISSQYSNELNDKNQLIRYTSPNYDILYKYDKQNKLSNVRINDIDYTVEYTDDEVLVKPVKL